MIYNRDRQRYVNALDKADQRGDFGPLADYLLVEVKGLEREADRPKDVGAKRWIDAVNHWGKLGRLRYAKIPGPYQLSAVLGVAASG